LSQPSNPVTVLVCACGKRLNAAGAVPGRLGRCPACGARFRVPPAAAPRQPEEALPARAPVGPSAFVNAAGQSPVSAKTTPKRYRDGLLLPPQRPETRLRESLLYPLWGATGLGLLLFMPPLFWFTSLPLMSLGSLLAAGNSPWTRFGSMFLFSVVPCFAMALGYSLLFLGRVLVSSALGEVYHPRWPGWGVEEMAGGVGRWFWAIVVGLVVGGVPAVAYWIYCGDVDPLDVVVLAELIAVGAVYAQMALLASLLHDDPLGANPITVVRALIRVGWRWTYIRACLVSGFALIVAIGAFRGLFAISQPVLAAAALWAFWVLVLYLAMVVLRVLGLCYHRHARAFGWFRDRPRWGV
jgi:hypothetical protein